MYCVSGEVGQLAGKFGRVQVTGISGAAEFSETVRPHIPAMLRLAARLGPPGAHEDLVQEALVRAWRYRGRYDESRGSFSAWLMTIVANEARRAASRLRGPIRLEPVLRGQSSDDHLDIAQAIHRLPARQRLAIDCYYFAGLSLSETAAVMVCTEGTVKSTLWDARQRLRRELEEPRR
jgi:RNA polymerase sigma-70 factor (ECF subfamily)